MVLAAIFSLVITKTQCVPNAAFSWCVSKAWATLSSSHKWPTCFWKGSGCWIFLNRYITTLRIKLGDVFLLSDHRWPQDQRWNLCRMTHRLGAFTGSGSLPHLNCTMILTPSRVCKRIHAPASEYIKGQRGLGSLISYVLSILLQPLEDMQSFSTSSQLRINKLSRFLILWSVFPFWKS